MGLTLIHHLFNLVNIVILNTSWEELLEIFSIYVIFFSLALILILVVIHLCNSLEERIDILFRKMPFRKGMSQELGVFDLFIFILVYFD